MNSYIWVSIAIFAHALDGMTDPWWNHSSGIIRILLRFTLMILSTDLLIYVIDSIKAMRATGIKPIALIFMSILEVFKPITRKATVLQAVTQIESKLSNSQRVNPEGNYILTALSNLITSHPKMSLIVFYILFAYTYFIRTLETTMFTFLIANYKSYYNRLFKFNVFILLLFSLIELYNSKTNKRCLAYTCIIAIGFIHWRTGGSFNLFILCILIVAMTDKSMSKVLKISIITTILVLLAAFWASQNGYIYNFIYPDNGHALGTVYKTDLMALWFYTLLKYIVLRDGILSWFEYPLLFVITQYLFHLTKAVTSTVCMTTFIVICFIQQIRRIKKDNTHNSIRCVIPVLNYSYIIAPVFSFTSVFFLTDFLKLHASGKITSILTRLQLSKEAFQKFPITLFGQLVPQYGNGGVVQSGTEYFFLDNSYIQLLIIWGMCLLATVLILSTKLMHKSYVADKNLLFLSLIIISIHSLIEHHLSQYWYNTFLVLVFANIKPQSLFLWDLGFRTTSARLKSKSLRKK